MPESIGRSSRSDALRSGFLFLLTAGLPQSRKFDNKVWRARPVDLLHGSLGTGTAIAHNATTTRQPGTSNRASQTRSLSWGWNSDEVRNATLMGGFHVFLSMQNAAVQTSRSSPERSIMGTKIYVGGLPYSTTEAQLNDLFATHGTVQSARIITDKFTGQSRGFGFVEMGSAEEAKKAITALNGTQFEGRTLTVNEAKPQEPRSGGGGGGRGGDRGGRGGRW